MWKYSRFILLGEHNIQSLFLVIISVYEATIFYIAPKILKLIQDLIFHIWCEYAKIHIILFSQFLQIIPSSFCPEWSIVKEVPFIILQMVWNFYSVFICSNDWSPPNLASFHLAIYPQQLFQVSAHLGSLWRKYHFGAPSWVETFPVESYV